MVDEKWYIGDRVISETLVSCDGSIVVGSITKIDNDGTCRVEFDDYMIRESDNATHITWWVRMSNIRRARANEVVGW